MNSFHELNILTSRGNLTAALALLKSRTESVARKIMNKAGYVVPDLYGRAFWLYAQHTIMHAARKLTSGYNKSTVTRRPVPETIPAEGRTLFSERHSAAFNEVHVRRTSDLDTRAPSSEQMKGMINKADAVSSHSSGQDSADGKDKYTTSGTVLPAASLTVQGPGRPVKDPEEINTEQRAMKKNILLKIAAYWSVVFSVFFCLSAFFGPVFTWTSAIVSLISSVAIYSLLFCCYHIKAKFNRDAGVILTFHKKDGMFHAGMPLCIWLPGNRFAMRSLLADSVCEQFQKDNCTVIMRSHFLRYPKIKDGFLRRMQANNVCWEETATEVRPAGWRRFILYWMTPVVIGSFQWRIFTPGDSETEIILTRGSAYAVDRGSE